MATKKNTADESAPNPALGKALDDVARIKRKLVKAEAAAAAVKKTYDEAADALLLAYNQAGATSVKSQLATGYVSIRDEIVVEDWDAFNAYVKRHNAFDLYQRRPASRACLDRIEANESLPVTHSKRRLLNIKLN